MIRELTDRFAQFVTTHNRLVILAVLVLTAGVAFGMVQDQGEADQGIDDDAMGDTDVAQAADYIEDRYGDDEQTENHTTADVYVMTDDGSAFERETLLAALEYQRTVVADETVAADLVDGGVEGPPNLIARALADDETADLDAQYDAIDGASDEEIAAAVADVFDGGEETTFFMPTSYEVGATEADSFRMTFAFEAGDGERMGPGPDFAIQAVLYETGTESDSPAIFADGQPVWAELNEDLLSEIAWLIIPSVLCLLVIILGFAYRDVTDVLIGFAGTVFALVWMAGLMGWMGLLNQTTAIVAPVLIAAISIDFGFHVFMRYRERRDPGAEIRVALRRSTAAVSIAFVLVTVTAAIGFLSNQFSPVGVVRDLGVAITLGVVAALIVFTTLVPALKVSADGLWERFGFDRRKTPLGKGKYLSRVLATGATLARRAPVAVVVVALVVGLVGGLAFTELDREAWQEFDPDDVPDWQAELPGPMAVESHESEIVERMEYVRANFQADREGLTEGGSGYTTMLLEGEESVATAEAMAAVDAGHEASAEADTDVVLEQGGEVRVVSVLTVMDAVAAEDEEFAGTLEAADTNDDGVPDSDLEAVFDELFALAPEEAEAVLERTDDGAYESTLVQVPARQEFGSDRAVVMYGIADEMADESGLEVTAVGTGTINDAEMGQITDGIVRTLLIAMVGVLLAVAFVYRYVHGSATLGAITVVPIALALGFVFGGMYLAGQPLTLTTALLVSVTIGLGIDYNIHLSDRFGQELHDGRDAATALTEAVTGTGGALLGSAVTSGGAFSLLVLVPEPQLTSFGLITALALGVSFLLSVFVLPSLLWLWATRAGVADSPESSTGTVSGD
ncbi:RND family transporter [Halovivax sp.]|uniref:efflux RND transporter permease subunit n=1 Tax=Halovivax sp. TaxID=1935978 RepID=UPI0025BFCBD0|nr:MMPL family transporter [Halovivax sp.]